jgi:hypothetical protein
MMQNSQVVAWRPVAFSAWQIMELSPNPISPDMHK